MGNKIYIDKNTKSKDTHYGRNKFNTPWRLGALADDTDVWHSWMFDSNGEPVEVDSDTIKFIVESVNKAVSNEK